MFQIGDRVRIREGMVPDRLIKAGFHPNTTGTIMAFADSTFVVGRKRVGIKWDKYCKGMHDLGGRCETGFGWWLLDFKIELVEPKFDDAPLDISSELILDFMMEV